MRLLPAVLAIAAGAALAARRSAGQGAAFTLPAVDMEYAPPAEPDQAPDVLDTLSVTVNPSTYLAGPVDPDTAARNERAFLTMLKVSEGTYGRGDDGYNVLYGGGLFYGYADHPRQVVTAGRWSSSAAGAYQILARTWDPIRSRLQLPDFGPASQDAAAIELIREWGALQDVRAGRFATAINKVRKVWASLPGAGYGQPENAINKLSTAYAQAGGTFSEA